VQILALASLFSFTAELNYPVLVSLGAMRDLLLRALIAWPPSALVIAGASHLGLTAAALSFLAIVPFQAYVSVHFVRRHVPVRWCELADACGRSAVVTLCSAVGPLGVVAALGFRIDMPVPAAVLAGALAAGGWLSGLWLTQHPLVQEIRLAGRLVRNGLRPLGI
jgi:O-antigen/teichoic acid export membrane protein